MRFPRITLPLACFVMFVLPAVGQSTNGNINGIVLDPSNRVIVGADIIAVNDLTSVQFRTRTNDDGVYVLPNLPPGPYRLQVSKVGFKTLIKPDLVLNVQDALSINFTLPIGALLETVTVQGGAPLVTTESAAVSTVIDRKYVENMPLNGRSFQDLIMLTPGVVTASPQNTANQVVGSSGEFSVNGQRTDSNYYSVDGVSANIGTYPVGFHVSTGGALPASTALGTTQALVSIDALEEFRVQSSSYSAEYGRNQGGQFSFVTRSGTNNLHGSLFDYVRNDLFDANDWFNNHFQQPRPALRQNDFGGTVGGPLRVPGPNRQAFPTFFFFSYEGLRLVQPQETSISYVPTLQLRHSAPPALAPVLYAFPAPYCPANATGCTLDHGNGLGDFIGSWSNPSSINAYSVRLDQSLPAGFKLFFRFSDTPSAMDTRSTPGSIIAASQTGKSSFGSRTYTLGLTTSINSAMNNDFRINYSSNEAAANTHIDNFGGAKTVNLAALQGVDIEGDPASAVAVGIFLPGYSTFISQTAITSLQRQLNLVDNIDFLLGRHQLKIGVDYRRLSPVNRYYNPGASYYFYATSSIQGNSPDFVEGDANGIAYPLYQNFSAFAQDEWRIASRLVLSMGLRWDVNPSPGSTRGPLPYTIQGTSFSTLRLAPQGTQLWRTTWYNFAPRLGIAYVLRKASGFETVVRTGGGLFFDTGQQYGSQGYAGPGFSASTYLGSALGSPVSFPLPLSQLIPPLTNPPVPPYGNVFAFPSHRQLPYAIQWNVAIQQGLGKARAFTASYVGSHAGRLLGLKEINLGLFNPNFSALFLYSNRLTSDYDAFQAQFQNRLTQGLQVLASYTWSHCLDYGSENAALPYIRGNCDFDVRHNFSSAVSYDLPEVFHGRLSAALLHHWGIDDRLTARTAFPIPLKGPDYIDPATGQIIYAGLNRVAGEPVYLYDSKYPGGKALNENAYALPAGCNFFSCPTPSSGDAARNFARGFGALQMDVAVRRSFPIGEQLKLQFRAEAFNVFNHPNFGSVNGIFGNALFGEATATLGSSLGVLSPLYQIGGPRSIQLALKLMF